MEVSKSESTLERYAADNLLQISCSELLLGMYVFELDCAWSKTPFPMGGFHLKNVEDIEILNKYCKFVTIDTNKGVQPRKERKNKLTILSSARNAAPEAGDIKVDRSAYKTSQPIKKQIDRAHRLQQKLKADFAAQMQEVRNGKEMDLAVLEKSITHLVKSIIANPQTHIWLLNTDPSERQETDYCVRAALWATVLARQVGLPIDDMKALFMGTLLADIGMQLLPERLVNKCGPFRKKEFLAYRKHVEFGEELISQYPALDNRVAGILRSHHERQDGLGFPRGLKGKQIPVLARFANLAYCFERLLRNKSVGHAVSPARALAKLYKQRKLKFPQQLVVELIHVMGTYPIGTLVQLSTGEIALILEQNLEQRLSPKVAVLTDESQAILKKTVLVDLAHQGKAKIDRSIVSGIQIQQAEAKGIKPRNYAFSFFGKRLGFGQFTIRI